MSVIPRTPPAGPARYLDAMSTTHTDPAATGSFQRLLPQDLVQEVSRTHAQPHDDLQVAWQPSLITRFLELFVRDR